MKIVVRLFAVAKQATGHDSVELELPPGASVADLRKRLAEWSPQLSGIMGQLKFAVDTEYADDTTRLREGADVACIPPVSGG